MWLAGGRRFRGVTNWPITRLLAQHVEPLRGEPSASAQSSFVESAVGHGNRVRTKMIAATPRMVSAMTGQNMARAWPGLAYICAWVALFFSAPFPSNPALSDQPRQPVLRSHGGQFTQIQPIEAAPPNEFLALDGAIVNLRQFRGNALVLNFWATWCAACTYELPALERLSAESRNSDLRVLAVSIDRDGLLDVVPYLKKHNVRQLAVYLDPAQNLGSRFVQQSDATALPLFSLPVTYFIDKKGDVLGYVSGAVDWDSAEAHAFIEYLRRFGAE